MAKKPSVKRTGRDSDQFIVRLPTGMRKQVARVAEREGRSMNSVIVNVLAMYFEHEDAPPKEPASKLDARIEELANQMGLLANEHQELTQLIKEKIK